MHVQAEDADADDHAPEIARQQADVEEGGRRQSEQQRHQRVEQRQAQRVPCQIAADAAGPGGGAERGAVEDAGLGAVDQRGPEAELADDFVQRPLGNEEFLGYVGHAVEAGASEGEEVAFELPPRADGTEVGGACEVVAGEKDAHAADADEDAEELGGLVAYAEEDGGKDDDDDNGPEIDKLR